MGKYMEVISEVANNIIHLYKNQLDSCGMILSGRTPTKVLMTTKGVYYDALLKANPKIAKQMPAAWTNFAWSNFVMFGPQGK